MTSITKVGVSPAKKYGYIATKLTFPLNKFFSVTCNFAGFTR
jgi:hypothetical protein